MVNSKIGKKEKSNLMKFVPGTPCIDYVPTHVNRFQFGLDAVFLQFTHKSKLNADFVVVNQY